MDHEIAIISGRMNPEIDPHLEVWGWEMPAYFFLGGLAAGLLILSGLFLLARKEDRYPTVVRYAPLLVPVALCLGLLFLMLDLSHPLYSWRLYLTFQPLSPISWGAWLLMFVTPLSMVYAFVGLPGDVVKKRIPIDLGAIHGWLQALWRPLAVFLTLSGMGIGVYTGVLLSTLTARPYWNSHLLGALFLCSGLTAAGSAALLLARAQHERRMLALVLSGTIAAELVLVFLFALGHATGGQASQEVARMLLGGELALHFLVFDVAIGLLAPLLLLLFQLRGKLRINAAAPVLALFGGLMLRVTMVHGGQLTGWLHYWH